MRILLTLYLVCVTWVYGALFRTTCDRIAQHGYPCESHEIQTKDGYQLTMFRIPYSHNLNNARDTNKSVVLLMHGLLSSSDCFVHNGPQDGLIFMLSDAGYDVWIGNSRGNDYSQKHVFKSPIFPSFWDFSWHEIGSIDVPTKIDYILEQTGQEQLHYIGHSQGGTTFFVLLSIHPEYNAKIKTSHLLAPAVYMEHMNLPFAKVLKLASLDNPNAISTLIGTGKLTPGEELINLLLPPVCKLPMAQEWCGNILFLIAGGPSPYVNETLLPEFFETHPVDCSTRQLLHFLQEQESKQFRRYDFGRIRNLVVYGSLNPPNYKLQNVNLQVPVGLYYSDNDDWVAVTDIHRLSAELGAKVTSHHVKYTQFNHMDFLIAHNVKKVINDCVLDQMNEFEGKFFTGNKCTEFLPEH